MYSAVVITHLIIRLGARPCITMLITATLVTRERINRLCADCHVYAILSHLRSYFERCQLLSELV